MSYKIWIASGILLMLAGVLGTIWGISKSFDPLLTEATPGIGEAAEGIKIALFCNVLFFVGLIPLIIGLVKFSKKK